MFNLKNYRATKLPANKLFFGIFYNLRKPWQKYLVSISASLIVAFLYWLFLQFSGVYSAGLSSFSQGFSRLSQVLIINQDPSNTVLAKSVGNIIFWLLFIALNIPLAIFSYFKVGRNFTKMTVVSFVTADLFGLGLGFIPNVEKIVYIFGDPLSTFAPLREKGVQILFWHLDPQNGIYDMVKILSLLAYAIVGSLLLPFAYAIIFIVGSSTGGTDFVSYYYSIKKHKPLGTIIVMFNTVSLFLGTFIGSYLAASLIEIPPEQNPNNVFVPWSFSLLLSPNLIASAISSVILGMIVNLIFPKTKMVRVKIYSNQAQTIAKRLFANNYSHSFTIHQATGAFSGKATLTAETICQFIEVPLLMKRINDVDDNALISVVVLNHVKGPMNILEKID